MGKGQGGSPRETGVPRQTFTCHGEWGKGLILSLSVQPTPLRKIVAGVQQLDIL
jgi:hypothetical protein